MNSLLKIENLQMYYFTSKGAVRAIDGIDLELFPGESIGLVGESGCGKTSLGTSILRMPTPPGRYVEGKIFVDGIDVIPLSEKQVRKDIRWQKISMVFQGAMNCLTPV